MCPVFVHVYFPDPGFGKEVLRVSGHHPDWKLQLGTNYALSLREWEEVDPKPKVSGLSQAVELEATLPLMGTSSLWPGSKVPETQHHLYLPGGVLCITTRTVTSPMNSMKRRWWQKTAGKSPSWRGFRKIWFHRASWSSTTRVFMWISPSSSVRCEMLHRTDLIWNSATATLLRKKKKSRTKVLFQSQVLWTRLGLCGPEREKAIFNMTYSTDALNEMLYIWIQLSSEGALFH